MKKSHVFTYKWIISGGICLFIFSSCGKVGSSAVATIALCPSLEGNWSACFQTDTNKSQQITINADATSLVETFYEFSPAIDCTGAGSQTMQFNATYTFGAPRASTRVPGATDAAIKPNVDFGCGVGAESYTVIHFAPDCLSFSPGNGTPGCTPDTAPTDLAPFSFNKF